MAAPRIFVPGLSHHVRHRGNNRCDVFLDTEDREIFLSMMGKSAQEHDVAIHGYALMTTHYHAQVTAPNADALPGMMQILGKEYVRYFNRRYQRTGTLWEGRYRSSLILDERYWFNCLRYIEANPVRAGIVSSPADYRWSSYGCNARGWDDPLVTPHGLYLRLGGTTAQRAERWALMSGHRLTEEDVVHIRVAIQRGRTLGPEAGTAFSRPGRPESKRPERLKAAGE